MGLYAYGNTFKCNAKTNEDAYFVNKIGKFVVLIVADGTGGVNGGINPGALAVSTMVDYLNKYIKDNTTIQDLLEIMDAAFYTSSRCFLSINSIDEQYTNVYASMLVTIIDELSMQMIYASVGNCELHLLRKSNLSRLNNVHTEAFELLKKEVITENELYSHPKRCVLTSALGVFNNPIFDINITQLFQGDILLLSTDGLFKVTAPMGILEVLSEYEDDINKGVDAVLKKANEYDSPDNCTLICGFVQNDNSMHVMDKSNINQNPNTYLNEPSFPNNNQQSLTNNQNIYNPYINSSNHSSNHSSNYSSNIPYNNSYNNPYNNSYNQLYDTKDNQNQQNSDNYYNPYGNFNNR